MMILEPTSHILRSIVLEKWDKLQAKKKEMTKEEKRIKDPFKKI